MTTATIAPFRALRFQLQRVGDAGAVWAPPYDVIAPEAAAELRGRHPRNIVRLTNPEGEGAERYAAAARTLDSWIADGTLVREERPALYVHRHSFESGGATHTRSGVWALVRLAPFGAGAVLPHERTMSGPKADRLALMRACRAQLSPIFFICSDPDGRIGELLGECAAADPSERTEFPSGQRHEIWRVENEAAAARLAAALAGQVLLIADGHHRYETALAYRDELIAGGAPASGRGAHQYVLAYVVSEGDPGLLLLPTHRIVAGGAAVDWASAIERTKDRFEVRRLSESELAAADALLEDERGSPSFVLVSGDDPGGWLLRLREPAAGEALPASVTGIAAVAFHEVFLPRGLDWPAELQAERVSYSRDPGEALDRVRSGSAQAAALLAPPRVAQVREAARAGERLPPKTTYFWPKVPTGIAMHVIDPEEEVG